MTLNVEPSDTFWQGTVFTLSVDLALQYNTEFSHASLPAVEVQAYLSSDTQWDPSSDVLLDSKIQEKGRPSGSFSHIILCILTFHFLELLCPFWLDNTEIYLSMVAILLEQ